MELITLMPLHSNALTSLVCIAQGLYIGYKFCRALGLKSNYYLNLYTKFQLIICLPYTSFNAL